MLRLSRVLFARARKECTVTLKLPYRLIATCAALATAVGCASKKAPDPTSTLSGTLAYRSDVKLSESAVVYVRLADITQGQIKSTTVLQQEIRPSGDAPIPFTLSYKDKWINPSHEYSLEARVVDRGQLQFISDDKLPVITNGNPTTVAMELQRPGRK